MSIAKVKIASRKSDLARIQSYLVGEALLKKNPGLEIEYIFRQSFGDQNLDVALTQSQSKGLFTEDFYEGLSSGEFDMVVHSWKDLPTEDRPNTAVVATLPREDMRDLLLVPKAVWQKALTTKKLTILSSSPRRVYHLEKFLSWALPKIDGESIEVKFEPVRGNVPTRFNKMLDQQKALVVAKAAVDRMISASREEFSESKKQIRQTVDQCQWMLLPLFENPNAPAQGALAIEIKKDRDDLKKLLSSIHHEPTSIAVRAEREILKKYGGGCHQKIGVACLIRRERPLVIVRGETHEGEILNQNDWQLSYETPKAKDQKNIFPEQTGDLNIFTREPVVEANLEKDIKTAKALWVAKFQAWPKAYKAEGQWVWVAGNKTWKKLAEAGVWVNGSSESLGEDEDFRLSELAPALAKPEAWLKLSHDQAPGSARLGTYRLIENKDTPDLKNKTHFYWPSITAFEWAKKNFPEEVKNGYHASGPGLTYAHLLSQKIGQEGLSHRPEVWLNQDDWRKYVL